MTQEVGPSAESQAPGEDVIISMRKVNKSYHMGENSLHVLKDIDFEVKKGEFVAILGASGSGKTTLMNLIGCMDTLDTGEYHLDGHKIHELKVEKLHEIRNKELGFIFQKYHLIPTYTVLQNIIMPLLARGMSHKEAEKQCMETIRLLGLDDRLGHRPSELSGGQQQRVAVARALVGEPALLLADEPTGALDSATGKEVLKLFQRLNDMGNTIVMITHDLNVAQAAKRIVRIEDGVLFQ